MFFLGLVGQGYLGAGVRQKNVLLIVVDALRADRLGCYGYTRVVNGQKVSLTPNIDRLAEKGALFENCVSQSNWTPTSMASMLYSVNPTVRSLSHSYEYLGEAGMYHCLFADVQKCYLENDYDRVAVQSNPHLLGGTFTSMFDHIVNVVPHPFRESDYQLFGKEVMHGDAAAVNLHAYSAVKSAARNNRSFILYLHYMDVHEPYPWRDEYRSLFPDGAKGTEDFGNLRLEVGKKYYEFGATGKYSGEYAERLQRLVDDYDASLMYLDRRVGELLNFLADRKLFGNTLIIFAADHGQEFGEHGNIGHCTDFHHEQARVPLICVGGAMPAGARVKSFVRNIDIIPTIEGYMEFYPKCDGENLLPAVELAAKGTVAPNREVFACSDYPSNLTPSLMMKMLISPELTKYILTLDDKGKVVREELYDLVADPDERRDLSAARPRVLDAARARLDELHLRPATGQTRTSRARVPTPIIRERLRSIGYLQ